MVSVLVPLATCLETLVARTMADSAVDAELLDTGTVMSLVAYYKKFQRSLNRQVHRLSNALWVLCVLCVIPGCFSHEPPSTEPAVAGNTVQQSTTNTSSDPTSEPAGLAADQLFVEQDTLTQGQLTLLVLGDSISAAYGIQRESGWVAKLQQRLQRLGAGYQVINASVSGETTQGGRARLDQALQLHRPDLVFIELGGNDALRGYPVESMRDNLVAMLRSTQQMGAQAILLGMDVPPNYGPRYRQSFRQTFVTAAEATNACLVPFFLEGIPLEPGMMQADGIHPTAVAQDTLLETGWRALQRCLGEDYPALLSVP